MLRSADMIARSFQTERGYSARMGHLPSVSCSLCDERKRFDSPVATRVTQEAIVSPVSLRCASNTIGFWEEPVSRTVSDGSHIRQGRYPRARTATSKPEAAAEKVSFSISLAITPCARQRFAWLRSEPWVHRSRGRLAWVAAPTALFSASMRLLLRRFRIARRAAGEVWSQLEGGGALELAPSYYLDFRRDSVFEDLNAWACPFVTWVGRGAMQSRPGPLRPFSFAAWFGHPLASAEFREPRNTLGGSRSSSLPPWQSLRRDPRSSHRSASSQAVRGGGVLGGGR